MKAKLPTLERDLVIALSASSALAIVGGIMHLIHPTYDGPVILIIVGIAFIIALLCYWEPEESK